MLTISWSSNKGETTISVDLGHLAAGLAQALLYLAYTAYVLLDLAETLQRLYW